MKFPLNELRKDFAPEIIILGIREWKEGMGRKGRDGRDGKGRKERSPHSHSNTSKGGFNLVLYQNLMVPIKRLTPKVLTPILNITPQKHRHS